MKCASFTTFTSDYLLLFSCDVCLLMHSLFDQLHGYLHPALGLSVVSLGSQLDFPVTTKTFLD